MINEWDLSATNLHRIAQRKYEVAVLPIGATEAHNRHLPEGEDTLDTTYIARRCCETAWPQCQSVICLPVIPYGVDCNLSEFPLSIHVAQSTLDTLVRDIITSLHGHGIRKIVLVNGHGGNDFIPLVRQIQCDLPVHVFLCNWWTVALDQYNAIFEARDDHAGEFETSVALALHPELVERDAAGSGHFRAFRFEALEKGWVRTSRDFSRLNDHCGVGDHSRATADKGRRYLDLTCERLTTFLVELAQTPIDETFPQVS
ncbi:MAG TPA: creatininase family protein [Phycisphaerae bacterium]|jgi:creatinine amidohydrolase|nr:creatininase family protein [Phycisphaerae bacterium]